MADLGPDRKFRLAQFFFFIADMFTLQLQNPDNYNNFSYAEIRFLK